LRVKVGLDAAVEKKNICVLVLDHALKMPVIDFAAKRFETSWEYKSSRFG